MSVESEMAIESLPQVCVKRFPADLRSAHKCSCSVLCSARTTSVSRIKDERELVSPMRVTQCVLVLPLLVACSSFDQFKRSSARRCLVVSRSRVLIAALASGCYVRRFLSTKSALHEQNDTTESAHGSGGGASERPCRQRGLSCDRAADHRVREQPDRNRHVPLHAEQRRFASFDLGWCPRLSRQGDGRLCAGESVRRAGRQVRLPADLPVRREQRRLLGRPF